MARFVAASEAVAAIPDGATVATDGFSMLGVAEAVFAQISQAFRDQGHPRDLTVVHASGQSDRIHGFEHFAVDGLVSRVIGSHWGLMPRMNAFLGEDRAEAVCLPQGQIAKLYRAIAAGEPGHVSRIGLGTFVDPRQLGGKVNSSAQKAAHDYVELLELHGSEYLFYRSFPIDVGIIRATTVDEDGNATQEEEAVKLDALTLAQAAHNSGGIVICQAKNRVPSGSLAPKDVVVPGGLIDFVVVAEDPQSEHRQTNSTAFDPRYISVAAPGQTHGPGQMPDGPRARIGRRAVKFLKPGDIVNLGTGIPGDTVGPALAETGLRDSVTLTIESGVYGGVPSGGVDFGIATFPSAIIPHANQFDFYGGGGLDATFMGAGQIDKLGNVNVSLLGGRVIGCGGFIDIVQSSPRVYFCFTFAGKFPKFVPAVDQVTFSAERALRQGQQVYYITDRAVFELTDSGLSLLETAPGFDTAKDILAEIPFPVRVSDNESRRRPESATHKKP